MSATFKANRNAVQDIAVMSVARVGMSKAAKAIAKGVEERTPVGAGDPRHARDAIFTYAFDDRYRVVTHDPAGHMIEFGSVHQAPDAPFRRTIDSLGLRVEYD